VGAECGYDDLLYADKVELGVQELTPISDCLNRPVILILVVLNIEGHVYIFTVVDFLKAKPDYG
jgi:hypothetical protein